MQRRFLSSISATAGNSKTLNQGRWSVKQVKKSNFHVTLDKIRASIDSSDFIALSLQNTGSYAAAWHRVSAIDTPQTSYLKAKYAAERYQILQFALCPFSLQGSKLTVHPYNFHLFPRDELKCGMPSYSFSCQASRLTSMAREGFDFNTCIYEGISYLSRAQESASKFLSGNPILADPIAVSSSSPATVADTVFVGRIRSRVKNWRKSCVDSSIKTGDDDLVSSLRRLVLGSEQYGSRLCLTIDVCSERQVQLILEMLTEFSEDVVPLLVASKSRGTQAVRTVFMSSKEDKDLFMRELQDLENKENRRVRGFREVIDLISSSQKPVISQNYLSDLTSIHAKFLGPLPANVDDFSSSLSSAFPSVVDLSQFMKEISPLSNISNLPAAMSSLNRFFAPVDVEVANQGSQVKLSESYQSHGQNAVMISQLFAKLRTIQKSDLSTVEPNEDFQALASDEHESSVTSCSQNAGDENVKVWSKNSRRVSSENLVFIWGLTKKMTAAKLKNVLQKSHPVFTQEFDVKYLDKSCAIVVFWESGPSETFVTAVNNEEQLGGSLKEMVAEGLRAAGYETYKKACRLGFWEADLAESLDKTLESSDTDPDSDSNPSEIDWSNDLAINFDEL
ncbi:PREDICTED: poly(A)-specific ribonuclease PARN-like isoform X1 [Camelina sativa]|uniref:Poly(A)-specific ribonuclease PARN-like isoform X1 n=1 Tax=Camelina sativa TaxID=90675 RepID=A0ABM0W7V5_CAMSA|nr:PREDICTED: poly(A)-specific ribonuclease PARN-like isoform X1 [Camelina sativa]